MILATMLAAVSDAGVAICEVNLMLWKRAMPKTIAATDVSLAALRRVEILTEAECF